MKQYLTLFVCVFLMACGSSKPLTQSPIDAIEGRLCCAMANQTAFAAFVDDADFVAQHLDPEPLVFISQAGGEDIRFATPDGQEAGAFQIKAKEETDYYLLVFHEWWGLNEHIRQEAEKYYQALGGKVNVLAIDMYDGLIATNAQDAGSYMQNAKPERLQAIIQGALGLAGSKARIATVGWCFGGGLSLNASLAAQAQSVACIIYYGMPISDQTQLAPLKGEVLGIFAKKDGWITQKVVTEFEQSLKALKKPANIYMYDADHAFANPSNPKYKKDDADDAFNKSIALLKKFVK
ncbi:dienelactone hydrolase family protein [Eisenibacter elegans]|uniref:dienelactone hydrolase family protein n=1 Tax=Eisenibacter elegans TaxID=997 RepID=UPI00047B6C87|nr:dienelactone hydrolase family protein [Eisenibacter elegans]